MRPTNTLCPRAARSGSIVVVILIAVVLAILGGLAVAMSTSFGRTGYHEKLVASSKEVARAAVEEASLLINNGKRNVEIDAALGDAKPVEVALADVKGGASPLASLPKDQQPKVFVKATVINYTTGLFRKDARGQMDSIQKFDLPAVTDDKVKEFWARVDKEGLHDKETGADTSSDKDNMFVNGYVTKVGVANWQPKWNRYKDPERTDPPPTNTKWYRWNLAPRMPALKAVFELFRTATGDIEEGDKVWPEGQGPKVNVSTNGSKPSLSDFKSKWEAAIKAVACDAAKKVEACGANPSLAMAHLVGDLKLGQEIASGAEVAATAAFMRDSKLGMNKTYLLELSATMGYEGVEGKMKGKTAFRTYRLFQKAEWEKAMAMMAETLAADLQSHGGASLSSQDLANLFPPDPADKQRNLAVPGKNGKPTPDRYDPKKMFDDLVYAEMPSTVGARLYPYGIASVNWNPNKIQETDKEKEKSK